MPRKKSRQGVAVRAITSAKLALMAGSVLCVGSVLAGSYVAVDALGVMPEYRTAKDKARKVMEEEKAAIIKAKEAAPELYPEPVEFYIKDFVDAYEKAKDE